MPRPPSNGKSAKVHVKTRIDPELKEWGLQNKVNFSHLLEEKLREKRMETLTYAEQALEHPEINGDNPWEDVFWHYPIHPRSLGVDYIDGSGENRHWESDGCYTVVFADNSRLSWNDSEKCWDLDNDFDLDEALEDFEPEVAKQIKEKVADGLKQSEKEQSEKL